MSEGQAQIQVKEPRFKLMVGGFAASLVEEESRTENEQLFQRAQGWLQLNKLVRVFRIGREGIPNR